MKESKPLQRIIRSRIYTALTSLATMIGLGTWLFHRIEDWSWAESFYFTVASLTTVGYGDLAPSSDASRVWTAIFILVGVGIVATALGSIGSAYAERRTRLLQEKIEKDIKN